MGTIIGIDLGTTNSACAFMDRGDPKVIINEEGGRVTPSVVGFAADGERFVGDIAKRQLLINPEATVHGIKRFMGRRHADCAEERALVQYDVVEGRNGDVAVRIGERDWSPQELSAMVLQKLKKSAEDFLGEKVTEAVITVPAYFTDRQRQATRDAGTIAGLDVLRIINEPTAAALAYVHDKRAKSTIAVYDFGGGTFDISILEVGDGVVEVKATNGDTALGGDDVDNAVIDWLVEEFKKDQGIDVSGDKMVLQRLKEAGEKAKIELSSTLETDINLPFLTADASGPKHLNVKLSRSKLEAMIAGIVERTIGPCANALKDAGVKASEIDEIVLVGGSTRIPLVQKKVTEFFGKEPHKRVNPDEVVALGAAIQAGVLSGDVKDILLLDVTPLTLGIETLGGVTTPLIPRNTTIPTKRSETFSTAADNQTSVTVHVVQGERKMAADNKTLGKFNLDGIPPAPRNVPQIEVTFDIDANGIVNVSAKDKATGKEQNIKIEASSGLSDDDIDRMVREAEENRAADEERQQLAELRNEVDTLAYSTEKLLSENGDKVSDEDTTEATGAVEQAREAVEQADKASLEAAKTRLETIGQKIAQQMYESAASQGGAPVEESAEGDDDVIDADFEESN